MELKSQTHTPGSHHHNKVLIVPLWNWNKKVAKHVNNCARSNCTFMELKCLCFFTMGAQMYVLIVPLWNWNYMGGAEGGFARGSNCTFMELKWRLRNDSLIDDLF